MPDVIVLYNVKKSYCKENIKRQLKWYDTIKGEMIEMEGGQIAFEYKEDDYLVAMGSQERTRRGIKSTYRMLPVAKDLEVVNYNKLSFNSNEKAIEKWVKNYINYDSPEAYVNGRGNLGIEIHVPEKDLDDFLYQAERNGFRTLVV